MVRLDVRITRELSLAATVAFLAVLLWYLFTAEASHPGSTPLRLLFFVLLGGLAIMGAVGIVRHAEQLVAVSVGGLVLLGFWQAVLWIYILPLAVVFILAGRLDTSDTDELSRSAQ